MVRISDNPEIFMDFIGDTERILLFETAVIGVDFKRFSKMAGDINTHSADGILVHLEDLLNGRLRICWNPAPKSDITLDMAVQTFRQALREGCVTCPDFKPGY